MRFVANDVETANADTASICAMGVAVFEQGQLSSEWYSLIDPEDHFDPINVSIHSIDEGMVSGAPAYAAEPRNQLPPLFLQLVPCPRRVRGGTNFLIEGFCSTAQQEA